MSKREKRAPVLKFGAGREKKKLGLYLHIPFCLKKCGYCDFYSVGYEKKRCREYLAAMERQMAYYRDAASTYLVDTVYLGGGTPSLLPERELAELFGAVRKNFCLAPDAEITMEVNPATGGKNYFKKAAKLGVNRFSVGLQSAVPEELAAIGRVHSVTDFERTMAYIARSGVEEVGVDLIYGLPGQTLESFERSLAYVTALPVTHISVYGLTLEEGTPLWERRESLELPDEECEREMYLRAVERLRGAGFLQDEISNFSKEGHGSRHNLKYWNCDEYLGVGAAAASFFGGRRFTFARNIARYIEAMNGGEVRGLLSENILCPRAECMGDYVMLRLRLRAGVPLAEFQRRYRQDFLELFGEKAKKYVGHGLAVLDGAHFALTPEGMYLSNYIIADLLTL